MKKSTLITTIAMIVVVVVALSTATYAWFSSSTSAVAKTQITTTAGSEWSLIKGTPSENGSKVSYTFNTSATDEITLSNAMASDLWSPNATIASACTSGTANMDNVDRTAFYSASTKGGKTYIKAESDYKTPDAIRVVNTQSSAKTLDMYVVVNAGQEGATTSSYYAAVAFSFYINAKNGTSANKVFYSKYSYLDASTKHVAASGVSGATNDEITGTATPETAQYGQVFLSSATTDTAPNYTAGNIATQFITVDGTPAANSSWTTGKFTQTELDQLGLTDGDHVIIYKVSLGSVAQGDAVNILLYSWIDGWVADASAAAATINVTYAFRSAS